MSLYFLGDKCGYVGLVIFLRGFLIPFILRYRLFLLRFQLVIFIDQLLDPVSRRTAGKRFLRLCFLSFGLAFIACVGGIGLTI